MEKNELFTPEEWYEDRTKDDPIRKKYTNYDYMIMLEYAKYLMKETGLRE